MAFEMPMRFNGWWLVVRTFGIAGTAISWFTVGGANVRKLVVAVGAAHV